MWSPLKRTSSLMCSMSVHYIIQKTLNTDKCTKSFLLVNYNTLLHVSTRLGHLQGETFRCRYTILHYTVYTVHCTVNSTFSLDNGRFLPEDDPAGSKHVGVGYNWREKNSCICWCLKFFVTFSLFKLYSGYFLVLIFIHMYVLWHFKSFVFVVSNWTAQFTLNMTICVLVSHVAWHMALLFIFLYTVAM
jgi:hypothetical protein